MNTEKTLQDEVKEWLEKNGRKKKWFAEQIWVAPAVLSQWFNYAHRMGYQRTAKIKEIIGHVDGGDNND